LKNELINLIICIENQIKTNEIIPDKSLKQSEIVPIPMPEIESIIEPQPKELIEEQK
jgi:hypothetical protein